MMTKVTSLITVLCLFTIKFLFNLNTSRDSMKDDTTVVFKILIKKSRTRTTLTLETDRKEYLKISDLASSVIKFVFKQDRTETAFKSIIKHAEKCECFCGSIKLG